LHHSRYWPSLPIFSAFAAVRLRRSLWSRQVRLLRSRVNFHLTRSRPLGFVRPKLTETLNTTLDMKKLFALSMLIPLAMLCSCQKQDAAAEQQLAQRKVELDTREKALDEREKALFEREKAMAHAARAAIAPADAQLRALKRDGSSNVSSATIPPGLVPPDNSQLKASREKRTEELRSLRQRRMEAIQRMRSMRTQPNSAAGAPADTSASGNTSGSADTSTSASTSAEATSPSPSATPQ
jgi:hypothetical protein